MKTPTLLIISLCLAASLVGAVPSIVEKLPGGVYVVRDDVGAWGGGWTDGMGITHQNSPEYQAKKVLDLTDVPAAVWQAAREVRLSAFFQVCDYSTGAGHPHNGLDEAFEVAVNGTVHRYATNSGVPAMTGSVTAFDWYDFRLPKSEFNKGLNEIILRKAPSANNDDYLYLGIDRTEKRGNSAVTFDGKTWTQEKLTVPGGNGEYMVRLYLLAEPLEFETVWQPGRKPELLDPTGMVGYAGSRDGKLTAAGLNLTAGQAARVEWEPALIDAADPVKVTVVAEGGEPTARWIEEQGLAADAVTGPSPVLELPANSPRRPYGIEIRPAGASVVLKSVTLQASRSLHPRPPKIDMCPLVSPPAGKPARREPSCQIVGAEITLQNASLKARFTASGRLALASLYNEHTQSEMLRAPDQCHLFLIEVGDKRYAGNRDFRCGGLAPTKNGFVATLMLDDPALRAELRGTIDAEGLRLGLQVTNAGDKPLDFKVAFPHLAGLAISPQPERDYYYYPWGGGAIADVPTNLRRGYGDYGALYQFMDLFSPEKGGGLSLRLDDSDGRYKVLALRKSLPGRAEIGSDGPTTQTPPEYKWSDSLEPVPGTSFACEYLRRTRDSGQSFAPADAVLTPHAGDWHVAMQAYADWAHRVWRFRPYPSRLDNAVNMWCVTWADPLVTPEGKYRTDNLPANMDIIEPWCWWNWVPLGPWRTPLAEAKQKWPSSARYMLKDPVTGQEMYTLARGDYDGYNPQWGGLPTFAQAVKTWQQMGKRIVLYTDPFLADDNTKLGRQHGEEWGVVRADGQYVRDYESWNMCLDVADYRQFVADTMGRVMRETGADGIRFDQFGFQGWACFNPKHQHTFAERGCVEWQRAAAETCKLAHAAMDAAVATAGASGTSAPTRPALMSEAPGYDYLLQFLDGCLTYDLNVQASALRPLECNTQRFFFPECKVFELDAQGRDKGARRRLWNGVAVYGWDQHGPPVYEGRLRAILRENNDAFGSRDCTPLTPTLARHVYANRFRAVDGGKTIYTIYNDQGHTCDGDVLAVQVQPGYHIVDLLNCRPIETSAPAPATQPLHLYLERDEMACLAILPQRLDLQRSAGALNVSLKTAGAQWTLALCDGDANQLASQPARAGENRISLTSLPERARPVCLKLMQGSRMIDLAAIAN